MSKTLVVQITKQWHSICLSFMLLERRSVLGPEQWWVGGEKQILQKLKGAKPKQEEKAVLKAGNSVSKSVDKVASGGVGNLAALRVAEVK